MSKLELRTGYYVNCFSENLEKDVYVIVPEYESEDIDNIVSRVEKVINQDIKDKPLEILLANEFIDDDDMEIINIDPRSRLEIRKLDLQKLADDVNELSSNVIADVKNCNNSIVVEWFTTIKPKHRTVREFTRFELEHLSIEPIDAIKNWLKYEYDEWYDKKYAREN